MGVTGVFGAPSIITIVEIIGTDSAIVEEMYAIFEAEQPLNLLCIMAAGSASEMAMDTEDLRKDQERSRHNRRHRAL